jgi:hypothetical protein
MDYININGSQHPYRRSMNALKKFDAKFKSEGITAFTPEKYGIEHLLALSFLIIEAGYLMEGNKMPFSMEELGDLMTAEDIESFQQVQTKDVSREKKSMK